MTQKQVFYVPVAIHCRRKGTRSGVVLLLVSNTLVRLKQWTELILTLGGPKKMVPVLRSEPAAHVLANHACQLKVAILNVKITARRVQRPLALVLWAAKLNTDERIQENVENGTVPPL